VQIAQIMPQGGFDVDRAPWLAGHVMTGSWAIRPAVAAYWRCTAVVSGVVSGVVSRIVGGNPTQPLDKNRVHWNEPDQGPEYFHTYSLGASTLAYADSHWMIFPEHNGWLKLFSL